MRRAQRRDSNELLLVHTARELGAIMVFLGQPVDWLCGFRGQWAVVEVKARLGRFTPLQKQFMARCKEAGLPVWVWRTVDDVLKSLGAS